MAKLKIEEKNIRHIDKHRDILSPRAEGDQGEGRATI